MCASTASSRTRCEKWSVYAALGIELSSDTREAMARWVTQNPRLSRRPSPGRAPFGLDAARVRASFAEYRERFGMGA